MVSSRQHATRTEVQINPEPTRTENSLTYYRPTHYTVEATGSNVSTERLETLFRTTFCLVSAYMSFTTLLGDVVATASISVYNSRSNARVSYIFHRFEFRIIS